MAYTVSASKELDHSAAANFTPGEVASVASLMDFLGVVTPQLIANVAAYKTQLDAATTGLGRSSVPDAAARITAAAGATAYIDKAMADAQVVKNKDLMRARVNLRRTVAQRNGSPIRWRLR